MSRFYLILASGLQLQYFFFCVAPEMPGGNGGKHMFGTSQSLPGPPPKRVGYVFWFSCSLKGAREEGSKLHDLKSIPIISLFIQGYRSEEHTSELQSQFHLV